MDSQRTTVPPRPQSLASMSHCDTSLIKCPSLSSLLFRRLTCVRYKCPQIRTTLVCPGHVQTTMFSTATFPSFPFFKFFCPSVQPVTVVKRIIAALDDQHSQTVLLPFYTNFIPYTRHLPSFLRDLVQWVRDHKISTMLLVFRISFCRSQAQIMRWGDLSKLQAVAQMKVLFPQDSAQRRSE